MTTSTPTVLVAAAPTLYREGLVAMLRERWPQLLLTLTADATQVVELLAHRTFGLLVLDGALPGPTLTTLLAQLQHSCPRQRLLLLAKQFLPAWTDGPQAWPGTCLQLPRHALPRALAAGLAPWLDASTNSPARSVASVPPCNGFSARELEVLRLVVADHCNQEIANALCLSVRTVESHRRTLLHKAGTRTLVGLAARAVREGWVA